MPRGGRLPAWVALLLPGGHGVVLVVQPDQLGREPPLDQSTERGSTAPAIRVAATLAIPRVMDLLQDAPCHFTSVAPPLASPGGENRREHRSDGPVPVSDVGSRGPRLQWHTSGFAGGRSSDSAGRVLPLLPLGGRVDERPRRRREPRQWGGWAFERRVGPKPNCGRPLAQGGLVSKVLHTAHLDASPRRPDLPMRVLRFPSLAWSRGALWH